ncbi:hypothetical protein LTR05_002534 [Lithohypha guttulata]|uniref:DUF7924 domain-containing protein n=1 Tax=Lithohypha guttulata TaxID=1690604 RepID=A0AAN7T4S6_9EURO|nr:hypothetical protein LTR05_002534 [Lithohypha guttulata]
MSLNSAISHSTNSSWFSRGSADSRSVSGRSQLHWKKFRKEVLAPHHIRIVDSLANETIPESICTWIEANRKNVDRFTKQRQKFRKLVANGRGFGSSALFPQEVLPSNDARPFLSRCMVPSLPGDALPEKVVGKAGSAIQRSFLSAPRPGLGCGFSSSAFAPEEIKCMPTHMLATGTTVHFDTGSISSGTALYCPFFSYERVFSQQSYGFEIAANQCAIDGAWSVRAMQMLYAKASEDDRDTAESFLRPIAFTCAIDNDIAIINYHWVDHAQTYCMAPVVRFELANDSHFDQFLLWSEAIGQWALTHLLPEVKKAISLLGDYVSGLPALYSSLEKLEPKNSQEEQALVSALKLSYDNIPWRLDSDAGSPVSSSTASWGSPMINEAIFAKFEYPLIPQPSMLPPLPALPTVPPALAGRAKAPGSVCSDSKVMPKGVRFAGIKPSKEQPNLNPGAYAQNTDLVVTKRLGYALDEIQDLQAQLMHLKQEISGSTSCLQNELSGLRKTMTCVIRKEKMGSKPRSPIQTTINHQAFVQSEHRLNLRHGVSVVTTPTDPKARPVHWPSPSPKVRTPSGLQNVLSLDTNVEAVSISSATSFHSPQCSAPIKMAQSPITIFSPTIFNIASPEETEEQYGAMIRVPNQQRNVWSHVAATHIISALVPATMLRILFLGCLLDYCMMSMSGGPQVSITQYLSNVLESGVF